MFTCVNEQRGTNNLPLVLVGGGRRGEREKGPKVRPLRHGEDLFGVQRRVKPKDLAQQYKALVKRVL